ncbi:MAG: hypothetical protein HKM03_07005 [Steroidobacteraceae bacterium]|nr:hypothetical protein [Steroidobacteraceae bacterium]
MSLAKPVVEQWYRDATGAMFEVVAIDEDDQTIEIQYFDGSVAEMDYEAWSEQMLEGSLQNGEAPEDWSGSVDIGTEDLDREFEDFAQPAAWSGTVESALRR